MNNLITSKWQTGKGLLVFLREIFTNPFAMGAAWPSSKKLAHTIVNQIEQPFKGTLVELGAGTGVITEIMLAKGIPAPAIVVIERSTPLCRHLQKRFPKLKIVNEDALKLTEALPEQQNKIDVIVSSLPLRIMNPNLVAGIENQVVNALKPNGKFIQFTYDLRKGATKIKQLTFSHSKYVWLNIPPARVDVFIKDGQEV